jgi:hypothetical protein
MLDLTAQPPLIGRLSMVGLAAHGARMPSCPARIAHLVIARLVFAHPVIAHLVFAHPGDCPPRGHIGHPARRAGSAGSISAEFAYGFDQPLARIPRETQGYAQHALRSGQP